MKIQVEMDSQQENEECFTHPFGAHKENAKASCEKYTHENGVSNDRKSLGNIFEEESERY